MNWAMTDDTPTATVVWTAAEQIGQTQNYEQLQKICDYLVNKHWFQTAADLRSAQLETTEWQTLEVPRRLKLAIQHVLTQRTPHVESVPSKDNCVAVHPLLALGTECSTDQWVEGHESEEHVTTNYYSSDHACPATTDSIYDQYGCYEQMENPTSSTYHDCFTASYEDYYDSTNTTSDDHESELAATVLVSLHSDEHVHLKLVKTSVSDDEDAVEAHVVDAAEKCADGHLDQCSYTDAVEHGDSSRREETETSGTWSCGQCTYLNSITSSFCGMCVGHISLSPDVKTTADTASLLLPAKPVVEAVSSSSYLELSSSSFTLQSSRSNVTCKMPSVDSLYTPSAPEYESSDLLRDESMDSASPSPSPACLGTSSCGDIDFRALAFKGSSVPKRQASSNDSSSHKSSQMRRGENSTMTECTF